MLNKERANQKLTPLMNLVKIIKKVKRKNFKKKLISHKTFQAIRIFVNKEISELIEGIIKATKVLKARWKIDCDKFSFN